MKIALLSMKEKQIFRETMRIFHYSIILILIVLSISLSAYSAEKPVVFWVPLKDIPDFGAVEWGLASFTKRSLLEAEKQGAEIVVFEIDTFGGRVDAMLFIKDLIMQAPM
ncbi:MAG TPA: hypothetical protein GX009_00915, partial [Candidatus Atribacteria bacterium]|nr:hypothetical protein [Candidatus Atribacteria bacterium]